jgi:hypothetical protein
MIFFSKVHKFNLLNVALSKYLSYTSYVASLDRLDYLSGVPGLAELPLSFHYRSYPNYSVPGLPELSLLLGVLDYPPK